jgi:hypothetical protein
MVNTDTQTVSCLATIEGTQTAIRSHKLPLKKIRVGLADRWSDTDAQTYGHTRTDTQTDKQKADLICPLLFFQDKEIGLKNTNFKWPLLGRYS